MDWQKTFGFGKYIFTLAEVRDLLISVFVLGFIFAFRNWSLTGYLEAIFVIGPALIFHELAHKFVAQRYGLLAGYALWPTGVLFSLFMTFVSNGEFVFAALGAVMISPVYHTRLGYQFIGINTWEMGKIAWSGPATNIGLAILSYIIYGSTGIAIFQLSAYINLIIAIFNCLPVPPLDGVKMLRWNIPAWLGTLAAALVLMFLPAYLGIWTSLVITIIVSLAVFFWVNFIFPSVYT